MIPIALIDNAKQMLQAVNVISKGDWISRNKLAEYLHIKRT